MSALFRSEFYTRMKRYWGENISIYDSKVKLFLKQGISHQLGRDTVVRFECENSAIDVIINFLWKIFHKPIVLVVLTTANFGGFSNFCRYYTRSQTGKSTGYRPTLKPLHVTFHDILTSAISLQFMTYRTYENGALIIFKSFALQSKHYFMIISEYFPS